MNKLVLCALLVAAAEPAQPGAFDPSEVAWFTQPGKNVIRGSAVLRTVGGETRTCAGTVAHLIPDSTYARARVQLLYGSTVSGISSARFPKKMPPQDPAYAQMSKAATCDPLGYFEFDDLPDGTYYVNALVSWGVPTRYFTRQEGGYLMQRVSVAGGQTKNIVLSDN